MFYLPCPTRSRIAPSAKEELAGWLHALAPWTFAVTVTIEHRDPVSGCPVGRERIVQAVCYFISRLNKALFGHAALRREHRVASVFVIETGALGDHPHVHLSVSCPMRVSPTELRRQIAQLLQKNSVFRKEYAIRPYTSANWHDYCVKHGLDCLVAEHIQTANP